MATRIYKTPFAATGDKEVLATADQPDGKVSLQAGWTPDYELPNDNANYRPVGRAEMNGILGEITEGLGDMQLNGFATWQAIDGGWPNGALVSHGGLKYQSTTGSNTTTPGVVGSDWESVVTTVGTLPEASTSVVGIVELATTAETQAGTDAARAVTPVGLNSVFVGAVQLFAKNSAPAGWLKANGAAVSRTTYAALFSAIGTAFGTGDGSTTFNLPDLRGEFLRGWDDGRGVDTGRVFGSAQADALQAFTGTTGLRRLNDGNSLIGNSGITGGFTFSAGSRGPSPRLISATDPAPLADDSLTFSPASAGARTASETRARNVALLACIKY